MDLQYPHLYGAVLHLIRPYEPTAIHGRTVSRILPLSAGDLVFIKDGFLSYFDIDRFEAVTVRVSAPFNVPSPPRRWWRPWR